jgi:hypothetical protein
VAARLPAPTVSHRRRAPGIAPPMVSPPYHLRRPPSCLIYHCKLKTIPSPPLRAPHRSLCSSIVTRAATMHRRRPRAAGPRRVAEHCRDPEPPPREQPLKSFEASAAHHLFHSHLINDLLIQPLSGPASTSMSFPLLPRSSPPRAGHHNYRTTPSPALLPTRCVLP